MFGNYMFSDCLIPFADFLNHSNYGCDYFFINTDYETGQKPKHKKYTLLKKNYDISILNIK